MYANKLFSKLIGLICRYLIQVFFCGLSCIRVVQNFLLNYVTGLEIKKNRRKQRLISGRSSGVRTHDLYVPNVALYQAELHSDKCLEIMRLIYIYCNTFLKIFSCNFSYMYHIYLCIAKRKNYVYKAFLEKRKI